MRAIDLSIGDVVTFQPVSGEPTLITHRIIAITTSTTGALSITTQGDNNPVPDAPIVAEQLQGRVIYAVPWVGWFTNALGLNAREGVLRVAGVALLGYALFLVVRELTRRRSA